MISALRTIEVRIHVQRGAVLALTRSTQLPHSPRMPGDGVAGDDRRRGSAGSRRRRRSDEVHAHIDAVHRGVGRSRGDLRERRAIVGSVAPGPGPSGRRAEPLSTLKDAGGVAPARWKFDGTDWWLEEHGLIMEQPTFPLPPGKYLVTGDREVTAVLTIHPADKNGDRRWELDQGATLYDVTHLACRSARYTPAAVGGSCSPANAQKTAFPVAPGGAMPPVAGCTKQDYAVLIVIGVGVED